MSCEEVDGVGEFNAPLTSRNDIVQLSLHGHLNLLGFFTVFLTNARGSLDGSRSSEDVIVSYHVLIDFGIVSLECGFKERFAFFVRVQLLFQSGQLSVLSIVQVFIVLSRHNHITGGSVIFSTHAE